MSRTASCIVCDSVKSRFYRHPSPRSSQLDPLITLCTNKFHSTWTYVQLESLLSYDVLPIVLFIGTTEHQSMSLWLEEATLLHGNAVYDHGQLSDGKKATMSTPYFAPVENCSRRDSDPRI
ncbi:hypothetical protein J6590_056673 [Homalodisca vitripennis]|nr:hypothetical protein J6590_056673 [Homalodisca vitripennis]